MFCIFPFVETGSCYIGNDTLWRIFYFSGENLFNVLIAIDVTVMQEHMVSLSTNNGFNILPYM